jgi:hypothetical protein
MKKLQDSARDHDFKLSATGIPVIAFTMFDGDWTLEARRTRRQIAQIADETEMSFVPVKDDSLE